MINTVCLAAVAVLLSTGQFLFKRAGLSIQRQPLVDALWTLATLPTFYFALAIYGFATILWIFTLSRVPLTAAYPWIAGTAAVIPLIGCVFFNEQVTPVFWVGMLLMIAGLLLTQIGTSH